MTNETIDQIRSLLNKLDDKVQTLEYIENNREKAVALIRQIKKELEKLDDPEDKIGEIIWDIDEFLYS